MNIVQVGPLPVRVEDRGSGPPLLFVHGFPLDHGMWQGQLDHFSATHRVLAPDLRGFGATPPDGDLVTMEQFADDLVDLLDALGIGQPVSLCGLSMGGYIAWQFARKYPHRLRSLVLCDTRAVADTRETAENRLKLARIVLQRGPGPVAEAMLPKLFSAATIKERPELVESVRQSMLAASPAGIAAAQRGMAERPDVREWLPEIRVPALVVVGAEDAISTVEEMSQIAETLPDARLLIVQRAGHMAPLERPELVNAVLADFW